MRPDPSDGGFHDGFPRIIVADDQDWIRMILIEVVRQTLPSATIVETADGLQALKAFRHGGCDFFVSNPRIRKVTAIDPTCTGWAKTSLDFTGMEGHG